MDQNQSFPDFYVTTPLPCPYLEGRFEQKLFTHLINEKSSEQFNDLHHKGFRRSQTIAYRHQCEGCKACVSIRIKVDEFGPSKSQKRITARNQDLIAIRRSPTASSDQYSLFRDYVQARHFDGGMADMTVYDFQAMIEETTVETFITEYYLPPSPKTKTKDKKLIAVSLCDQLDDGISMVYSFFDIEESNRSLGSYMILDMFAQAKEQQAPHVYLGYWVKGSPKMDYKAKFQPQEHLLNGEWTCQP